MGQYVIVSSQRCTVFNQYEIRIGVVEGTPRADMHVFAYFHPTPSLKFDSETVPRTMKSHLCQNVVF